MPKARLRMALQLAHRGHRHSAPSFLPHDCWMSLSLACDHASFIEKEDWNPKCPQALGFLRYHGASSTTRPPFPLTRLHTTNTTTTVRWHMFTELAWTVDRRYMMANFNHSACVANNSLSHKCDYRSPSSMFIQQITANRALGMDLCIGRDCWNLKWLWNPVLSNDMTNLGRNILTGGFIYFWDWTASLLSHKWRVLP